MIYYLQEVYRVRQSKTKINLHNSTEYIRIKQDTKQRRGSTRNRKETSSFWDAELTRTASDLIQGKQPANVHVCMSTRTAKYRLLWYTINWWWETCRCGSILFRCPTLAQPDIATTITTTNIASTASFIAHRYGHRCRHFQNPHFSSFQSHFLHTPVITGTTFFMIIFLMSW